MSYLIADKLEMALDLLLKKDQDSQVIAGATDLFLQELPERLIDISTIPELLLIVEHNGVVEIGATVTHSTAAESGLINKRARALAEACSQIGSPQIRNSGTIGGNVVNAAPAADAAVALVALGAEALIISCENQSRREPVDQLYIDYNCSAIDSGQEIIQKFMINTGREGAGEGSAFLRFAARQSLSLPLVNAAAWVRVSADQLQAVRLVVAPVKPAPTRLTETEKLLLGAPLNHETWEKAAQAAADEVAVRGSLLRCSARYRRHLVGVLSARVLQKAAERAIAGKEVHQG